MAGYAMKLHEAWESGLIQLIAGAAAVVGTWLMELPQKWWGRFTTWRAARKASKVNMANVLEQMRTMGDALTRIVYQVSPNGGGSMRDALDRVVMTLEGQNTEMAGLRKDVALVTALNRFQGDISDEAMYQCGPDGRNSYVSLGYQRLLGVSERDLRDWGWKNYIAPEEIVSYAADVEVCIRERRKFQRRVHFVRADGQRTLIDVTMLPYPDDLTQQLQSLFGHIKPVSQP